MIGVAKDGTEDSEGSSVVEDCAEGNGGGLDWWEVWGGRKLVCVSL